MSCGKHCRTLQTEIVFRIPILQEILKTQGRHRKDFCASSEVERLLQLIGCARRKLHSHTVPQRQMQYFQTLAFAWTVHPHGIACVNAPRCVLFPGSQAHDALHHGRDAPERQLPEAYRQIGLFWRWRGIFVRPLVPGSHLFELLSEEYNMLLSRR